MKIETIADSSQPEFQITNIKQAVKNPNRANIFIDGNYYFSLDISQLADAKLKIGQKLNQAEIDNLKHASDFGKLYQRTLEWVLMRPRSVQEARDYLRRKQFEKSRPKPQQIVSGNVRQAGVENDNAHSPQRVGSPCFSTVRSSEDETECCHYDSARSRGCTGQSAEVLDRLISKNYLNDEKFARYFVENYRLKKGISTKRLILELRKKGISQTIIDATLSELPRDDQQEITKIITKKRAKYPGDPQKLIQYLVRQGFDYESAKTAVLETDSQNSA
jgi:regulatory protein